jgi:thymidylate kinase
MFVVFEGIDGSGKTTVSGRVAKALRKQGIAVEHFREGGEFASSLVNRLRENRPEGATLIKGDDVQRLSEILAGRSEPPTKPPT